MKNGISLGLLVLGFVGAVTASEVRYVDEFDLSGASCGMGKRTLPRQSVDGHPLTVHGKVYERGFGSHSEGAVGFRADGKVEAFDALVGVDDDAAQAKKSDRQVQVVFKVWADGRIVWTSPVMREKMEPVAVHVDLKGVREIILETSSSAPWLAFDACNGDWLDARFTCADGAKVEARTDPADIAQLGILTPAEKLEPRINGADIWGVRPGHQVIFRVATSGERPMKFTAKGLPDGVTFDAAKDVPPLLRTERGDPVGDVATWEKVRRPEILRTFEREMFGVRPVGCPADLSFETLVRHDDALLSKAILKRVRIRWKGPRGGQTLLVTGFFPLSAKKRPAPCFLFLSRNGGMIGSQRLPRDAQVHSEDLNENWPVSRLIERGYATVAFDVTDVAEDDDSGFKADVFDCFQDPMDRTAESWGALSAWAWGASRVMDWLETEPLVDARHVAVAGLSRRGKSALWAGATDRRFAMACACGSGTCGAKLNHVELEGAESLCRISRFRHWFCRNFDKWAGKDMIVPFDQHWLLALMAPRLVAVGSGSDDPGAGPEGERLSTEFAKPAWDLYGVTNGVSYHVREGGHAFRLYDWEKFMDFADAHGWTKGESEK